MASKNTNVTEEITPLCISWTFNIYTFLFKYKLPCCKRYGSKSENFWGNLILRNCRFFLAFFCFFLFFALELTRSDSGYFVFSSISATGTSLVDSGFLTKKLNKCLFLKWREIINMTKFFTLSPSICKYLVQTQQQS